MARSESDQAQINYNRLYPYFTEQEAKDLTSTTRRLPSGNVVDVKLLNLNDPLVRRMIRTRQRAVQRAREQGVNRRQFLQQVITSNRRRGIKTVWDLLRRYEDDKDIGYKRPPGTHKAKTEITDKDIARGKRKIDTVIVSTHRLPDGRIQGFNAAGRFVRYL